MADVGLCQGGSGRDGKRWPEQLDGQWCCYEDQNTGCRYREVRSSVLGAMRWLSLKRLTWKPGHLSLISGIHVQVEEKLFSVRHLNTHAYTQIYINELKRGGSGGMRRQPSTQLKLRIWKWLAFVWGLILAHLYDLEKNWRKTLLGLVFRLEMKRTGRGD